MQKRRFETGENTGNRGSGSEIRKGKVQLPFTFCIFHFALFILQFTFCLLLPTCYLFTTIAIGPIYFFPLIIPLSNSPTRFESADFTLAASTAFTT